MVRLATGSRPLQSPSRSFFSPIESSIPLSFWWKFSLTCMFCSSIGTAFRLYGEGCSPLLSGCCPALPLAGLFLLLFSPLGSNSPPTSLFCLSSFFRQPAGGGRFGQLG